MRSIKLASLSFMLMLLFSAMPVFAQDDDTERIKLPQDYALVNDFGTLLFSYPDEWGVTEMFEAGTAFMSTSAEFLADPVSGLGTGEASGVITLSPIADIDDLSLDMSLEDLSAHYLGGAFFEASTTELALGSNTVILAEQTNDRNDMRLYTLRFGDIVVYADMRTLVGEITSFIDTMDAFVASMDFTTQVLMIEEDVPTDDDDTSTNNDIVLSETLTVSDDFLGTMSVNYPAGWLADEGVGSFVVSNSEVGLDFEFEDGATLAIGEIAIGFVPLPNDAISTLFTSDDNTASALLTEFIALLNEDELGDIRFDNGEVQSVEINDFWEVAQSTGIFTTEGENPHDAQFIAMLSDNGGVLVLVIAGGDTLEVYQETIYDMLQSVEYRAP